MNSKPRALDSIEYTKTRKVAVDPEVLRNNRIIMGLRGEPRSDVFRVLRTHILRQLRDNDWSSFGITSATPNAGKTFVSINLALAMALDGNQSVLLVDGDFRRPSVAESLGVRSEFGLVDCLTGKTSLEEVLINPGFERLVILPGCDSGIDSSELISSPRMADLVREMKSRYESRIVIFDMPPLFVADDAMLFMPYVDGVVLIAEDEQNTPEELQMSIQILEHTNLLGIVLNKSKTSPAAYRYGQPLVCK